MASVFLSLPYMAAVFFFIADMYESTHAFMPGVMIRYFGQRMDSLGDANSAARDAVVPVDSFDDDEMLCPEEWMIVLKAVMGVPGHLWSLEGLPSRGRGASPSYLEQTANRNMVGVRISGRV